MSAPDVSVIVRSIGRPTLARTLASIALQREVSLEVLLVAASGPAHPPPTQAGAHPLHFVASPVPLARAAAANAGLDAADGKWITWLDDDDEWLVGHLRGLLDAAAAQPSAGVVHSLASVRIDGEPDRSFGHPLAVSELYEENFLHPSTALVAREHVAGGCRCDESLQMHEDWDWFLQCAQRAKFYFVRQQTFVWHAGIGDSGAGGGRNIDAAAMRRSTAAVHAKWASARARLQAALAPLHEHARSAVAHGEWARAAAGIRAALALNPNDPDALALMAAVERASGRLAEAQAALALASLVRPNDAMLVYNLALICRERGDLAKVRDCALRLGRMAQREPRAAALRDQLDGTLT